MHDYHEDRMALIDLFKRCESTNQKSASMSNNNSTPPIAFHCEFTDYLWSMEQYPESYCIELVDSTNGRVLFACVYNFKRVHCGEHIMTLAFVRLARVDPDRRRQHLIIDFVPKIVEAFQHKGLDISQGYTLHSNIPSLTLQRDVLNFERKEISLLDIFVLSTAPNMKVKQFKKLNQSETEHFWMADLADWICRPVLSDLRRIMMMKEYKGTFIIGDFPSGEYLATSVWQSSSALLINDLADSKNPYRGPYWLAFNFFQSPASKLNSKNKDNINLLFDALTNEAFNHGIPFLLCHLPQSSIFNPICRKRAIAVTTEILSRRAVSRCMVKLGDQFDKSPVWLDPRDFSALLYFHSITENIKSQL